MDIEKTALPGALIITPKVFGDSRGFFLETWNAEKYENAGLPHHFVQDNLSSSKHGVLRGLHYQKPNEQGKLVYVLRGAVFDVAVDIRKGSPTFGVWAGVDLNEENKKQLYIPPGFAHGFCVTRDDTLFAYKCTDIYNPEAEGTISWNDPDIGISWPISSPELSVKDQQGVLLSQIPLDRLPAYKDS